MQEIKLIQAGQGPLGSKTRNTRKTSKTNKMSKTSQTREVKHFISFQILVRFIKLE
jgi:hypothetical protein